MASEAVYSGEGLFPLPPPYLPIPPSCLPPLFLERKRARLFPSFQIFLSSPSSRPLSPHFHFRLISSTPHSSQPQSKGRLDSYTLKCNIKNGRKRDFFFGGSESLRYQGDHVVYRLQYICFSSFTFPYKTCLPCLYSTFHLEYPLVLSRFYKETSFPH